MRYGDFIEVNENFQASINLEFDLNKIEKIRSYIPTEQSVKLLGMFLKSFYYSKESQNRASVLIGPYGRGKSHLLLVLSALTSMDLFVSDNYSQADARKLQLDLCKKIEKVNRETGALATAIVNDGIRTLPVIINSNSPDINQAFLVAIKDALEKTGLDYLLPETYFDAAIDILDKWKKSYPEVINIISSEMRSRKSSFDELYIGLKQFNRNSYEEFCQIYPLAAAGTMFNPLTNMDVVKLYLAVADALCEQTPYCGINIIFDEFSKFLEANLDASNMLNFKIIQDMAEAATRSGNKQIHFTCVTHKEILDYSSSDSFKTVEGRFNRINYIASSEQSYELIANAIPKTKQFKKIKEDYAEEFASANNMTAVVDVFNELSEVSFEKKVVEGCFPLAPISAFSLLHISELVGQNERTLFTFLAKKEKNSLAEFLEKDHEGIEFLTIDFIYDYFQELFKKEIFNSSVHSIWAKTDTALRQAKDGYQQKILKAIAIINIIRDERLKPVPSHIKAALMMKDSFFENSVRDLSRRHVLSQRDSSELVLLTANGVDVQRNVENYVNSKINRINICELLNQFFSQGYVIPREYNDRFGMLRYFKKVFLDVKTFTAYNKGSQLINDYPYDGLIIYIVSSNVDECSQAIEHIGRLEDSPEIIICVSSYTCDLGDLIKKIVAIEKLKASNLAEDPHYLEEIEIYEEDLRRRVQTVLGTLFSPSSRYSEYRNCTGILPVYRQVDLNHLTSSICLDRYCKTPVINNEMVNKKKLNSQNLKGRNITVEWILHHSDDEIIPCMEGYGPEVSIFKSMFLRTGLYASEAVSDQGISDTVKIINEFINSCDDKGRPFKDLYEILLAAPFGIRKGIIPLFIAYALRKYKDNIVLFFKGKEIELNASSLSSLNDNPEAYSMMLEKGSIEREDYLHSLETLFNKYGDSSYTGNNRIISIVHNMQTWMRSLPEYTKKFSTYYVNGTQVLVDNSTKVIRKDLLKYEINSRELLFEKWRGKLSTTGDLSECFTEIRRVKELLDTHVQEYKNYLIKYLIAIFVPGYTGSLSKAINIWFDNLPESTKKHVFDSDTNALIQLIENWDSYDDQKLVNELAQVVVSMGIEDWTDLLASQFSEEISATIEKIDSFVEMETDRQKCNLAIDLPGIHVEKTFSDTEISPLGKTALSNLKSVFEEYNDAIEPEEQLAIIARLIGDIIQ